MGQHNEHDNAPRVNNTQHKSRPTRICIYCGGQFEPKTTWHEAHEKCRRAYDREVMREARRQAKRIIAQRGFKTREPDND